jgi:hypothetical protein
MLTTVERRELARCLLVYRLACGCEVAVYQTVGGGVLTVVDDPDDECPDRGHQADFVLADDVSPQVAQATGRPATDVTRRFGSGSMPETLAGTDRAPSGA